MWYLREQYKTGRVDVEYMSGKDIPADVLTMLGTKDRHIRFARQILDHDLLASDNEGFSAI